MPPSPAPVLSKVFRAIKQAIQQKASGKLILRRGDRQWFIAFRAGKILYATDNYHRVRRWQRMLRQNSIQFVPHGVLSPQLPLWEYTWLELGVNAGDIAIAAAQQVIEKSLWEVLVVAAGYPNLTLRWSGLSPEESLPPLTCEKLYLPLRELEPLAKDVHKLHQRLRALGIAMDYLDGAPVFQQANWAVKPGNSETTTYIGLVPLLNGRRTMLDVMVTMRQPLAIVAHIMRHLIRKDAVEFRTLRDRPLTILPPFAPNTRAASMAAATTTKHKTSHKVPLIACVDDSPQVCADMEAIIKGAGYRCISTQDSLQAVSLLLQEKPDLVFLDLIMPIVNGYEVCKQLRRVKRFKTIPIAIVTGNDGAIDRVRAKVVGASDFIAKPIESNKILALLQKYFSSQQLSSPKRSAIEQSPIPSPIQSLDPSSHLRDLRSPFLPLREKPAAG